MYTLVHTQFPGMFQYCEVAPTTRKLRQRAFPAKKPLIRKTASQTMGQGRSEPNKHDFTRFRGEIGIK